MVIALQVIGKACPDFPVAGNALYEAADCPSPVPDLCDLSFASDLSDLTITSLTAQTFIYPGDTWPTWHFNLTPNLHIAGCAVQRPCRGREEEWAGVCLA